MANLTKNELKAKLSFYISLAKMSAHLFEELDDFFMKKTQDPACEAIGVLTEIDYGEYDLEKAMKKLEKFGILDGLKEGAPVPTPYIEAINPICIEVGVQYPSGEKLTAFLAESDSGTYQAGSIYYTEKGTIFDLSLSEIKKGSLAEGEGLSLDNKDIDIYVWGNAFTEDYTEKIRLSHKDIVKSLEEDDLSETETPPVLK